MKPINNIVFKHNVFNNDSAYSPIHLYYAEFNSYPNIQVYDNLSINEKGYAKIMELVAPQIIQKIRYTSDGFEEDSDDIVDYCILKNNIIFVGYYNASFNVYYKDENPFHEDIIKIAKKHKKRVKPSSLQLIVPDSHGNLMTKSVDIKKTKLDIGKYYNDDFQDIHNTVVSRLNTKNDKGIVLLHGLPGTGKTTYLRYLTSIVKKNMLYLPSTLSSRLTDPAFLDFLVDYAQDSILILEDSEEVIKSRMDSNDNGSVSNLLNISDGLLSDVLNIQLVCTFNADINQIDSALMRKGRLIAKYEFKELEASKTSVLMKELHNVDINNPMSISDIINYKESDFNNLNREKIGFNL